MHCTHCGAANADGQQYCTACGRPLNAVWQSPRSELVSAAASAEEIIYAGFWERFAALVLDSLLLTMGWMVVAFVGGVVLGVASAATHKGLSQAGLPLVLLGIYVVPLLVFAAYFVLMESGERGATLGKRALKLRVVDGDGQRIGKGRALGRFFAHFLSGITFYIGYLIQPFTERKQALHDMVAGTLVIRTEKNRSSLGIVIAVIAGFFAVMVVIGILAAVAIPAYQSYIGKAGLIQADVTGKAAAHAVERYAAKTGKVPATIAETGVKLPAMPAVKDVTVDPQSGEVRVVLGAVTGRAAGKALVFDPEQDAKGQIVWKCSGPGIPFSMLPADCR